MPSKGGLIYHLTYLMYRYAVMYLPLGNFMTLKITNLASDCRYSNEYNWVDLCRPWNESQWPVLPRSLTVSADAASYQAYCRWYTFVFQQDNAPSHRVKDTIKLLQQQVLDFIGPDLWPPNSLDLNTVDYKVLWCYAAESVWINECRMNSVDELKQRLVEVWNSLQQNVIDAASMSRANN